MRLLEVINGIESEFDNPDEQCDDSRCEINEVVASLSQEELVAFRKGIITLYALARVGPIDEALTVLSAHIFPDKMPVTHSLDGTH